MDITAHYTTKISTSFEAFNNTGWIILTVHYMDNFPTVEKTVTFTLFAADSSAARRLAAYAAAISKINEEFDGDLQA